MAETDEIIELGWKLGFSGLVSNAVYQPIVFNCYTWRFHRDVSWMLYHRKMQNCQNYIWIVLNCSKLFKLNHFKISKFGFNSFGLWGWASFLSVDWLLPALTQKMDQYQITIHHHLQPSLKLTTSSVCASRVYQNERVVYHHWFACTMGLSTVPACQMS